MRRRSVWLGLVTTVLLACAAPPPAHAQFQELFTWWRRQLLPLSVEPGAWVRLERHEAAAGDVQSDTLTCRVLEAEGDGSRWIEVRASRSDAAWILHVHPDSLGPSTDDPFDALLDLYHQDTDGVVWQENVEELEESRMVRRHLDDLFRSPTIERHDLPDSMVAGTRVARERVTLTEVQEVRAPMGERTLVHVSDLRSVAVLSPDVPVFGLLSALTDVQVESRWESSPDREPSSRHPPPLYTEIRIRCIGFGTEPPRGLPEILRRDSQP